MTSAHSLQGVPLRLSISLQDIARLDEAAPTPCKAVGLIVAELVEPGPLPFFNFILCDMALHLDDINFNAARDELREMDPNPRPCRCLSGTSAPFLPPHPATNNPSIIRTKGVRYIPNIGC